jgi:hypothetical protein
VNGQEKVLTAQRKQLRYLRTGEKEPTPKPKDKSKDKK